MPNSISQQCYNIHRQFSELYLQLNNNCLIYSLITSVWIIMSCLKNYISNRRTSEAMSWAFQPPPLAIKQLPVFFWKICLLLNNICLHFNDIHQQNMCKTICLQFTSMLIIYVWCLICPQPNYFAYNSMTPTNDSMTFAYCIYPITMLSTVLW